MRSKSQSKNSLSGEYSVQRRVNGIAPPTPRKKEIDNNNKKPTLSIHIFHTIMEYTPCTVNAFLCSICAYILSKAYNSCLTSERIRISITYSGRSVYSICEQKCIVDIIVKYEYFFFTISPIKDTTRVLMFNYHHSPSSIIVHEYVLFFCFKQRIHHRVQTCVCA